MAMTKKTKNFVAQSSVVDSSPSPTPKTLLVDSTARGDSAWLAGAVTLAVLLLCILLLQKQYSDGVALFGAIKMDARTQIGLIIAVIALITMVLVEDWRCRKFSAYSRFRKPPQYDANFFVVGFLRYLEHLALLWLIQLFYQTADEYGFANKHPFYQPWHQLLDVFISVYIWLGLPYLLLVRSFKWHEAVEQRDYGLLLELGFWSLVKRLPWTSHWFNQDKIATIPGKAIFLDLLVKMFFLPQMFVFF